MSDRDAAAAQKLARAVGASAHGTDNRALIARPEVNAVIVSTSEGEHVAPVLAALELGKPVLVEKPLALKLGDADRIIAAAEKAKADLRVGYSRRYKERYLIAKEQSRRAASAGSPAPRRASTTRARRRSQSSSAIRRQRRWWTRSLITSIS